MLRFSNHVLVCVPLLASVGLSSGVSGAEPAAEFFEAKVRPLLVEKCQSCHGPKKQMSGLRLDSRAAALAGGENGPAILLDDLEHSPLLLAARRDEGLAMPPEEELAADQVEILERWIRAGAIWPETGPTNPDPAAWRRHWAFQPFADPPVPEPKDTGLDRRAHPIDCFLGAKLAEHGLNFAPPADRRTLLRRVSFDLVGLPPTPEEVRAFESDPTPTAAAFAKEVERLLASPRYGERWGRHWLDVARYADNKGYVFFEEQNFPWSYTYRDYVIRAFNEDLPYDRFVLEQLAADQLELGADQRALAAMGFLSLGGHFMNVREDILDDRIDVVTRGLLGLTVSCARCHDHKYDPIPTKDYYSLFGVFASSVEPVVPPLLEPPPATEEYAKFAAELELRERRLAEFVESKYATVTQGARRRAGEYLLAAHRTRHQPKIDNFMLLTDGGDINPLILKRWQTFLAQSKKAGEPVFAPWHALAEIPDEQFAARGPLVIERIYQGTLSNLDERAVSPLVARALRERAPTSMADVADAYGQLLARLDERIEAEPALVRDPTSLEPDEAALWQVLRGPDSPASVPKNPQGDLDLLPDRASQDQLKKLLGEVEQWRVGGPGAPPRAMVLVDLETPVNPRVHLRGNPHNLGEAVPRQFLGVLAGPERRPFEKGSGRLELARAIVDPANPLAARVLVNRVWMHHFGEGLVRTPGDFGLRSDAPSHPELLDWLARRFIEDGWSIKSLHRRILASVAYAQASADRPDGSRVDPENRLWWRARRQRLDFEALRDSILAVSGGLDPTMGGPPVDLFGPSAANPAAGGSGRRSIYGFIDRLNLPGLLRTFDFPSPDATSPRRDVTTVAPQALYLMNHPFLVESARRLVERPEVAGEADFSRRAEALYRLVYQRAPSEEEVRLASDYIGKFRAARVPWQRLAQALLVSNEFAFVD